MYELALPDCCRSLLDLQLCRLLREPHPAGSNSYRAGAHQHQVITQILNSGQSPAQMIDPADIHISVGIGDRGGPDLYDYTFLTPCFHFSSRCSQDCSDSN